MGAMKKGSFIAAVALKVRRSRLALIRDRDCATREGLLEDQSEP